MNYIISAITYIFDIFIISSYLKSMLKNFKKKYSVWYVISLASVEILLYVNERLSTHYSFIPTTITTLAISMLTTFGLSFFFANTIKARILTALSFQVLVSLGETFFTFIITNFNTSILQITDRILLYSIMNLGSKVMLFLLCMVTSLFFRNVKYEHPVEYSILLFTTPVITVTIFSFTPLQFLSESNNLLFYEILFVCLTLLNIVNYVLIQKTFAATIIKYTNMNIQRQLDFQKKKYEQLGESYRQTRRIIHDVKNHYFYIQEQINNHHYDQLLDYTSAAIHDMEDHYAKYNTGNLVIDSFLTSYDNLAVKNNISFYTRLNLDFNRIPVGDYDLCTILGNILDNCITACRICNNGDKYISISIETTDDDRFVIHCENRAPEEETTRSRRSINHGFGMNNIQQAVEKYHGYYVFKHSGDIFYTDIMVPIIDESKRLYNGHTLKKSNNIVS